MVIVAPLFRCSAARRAASISFSLHIFVSPERRETCEQRRSGVGSRSRLLIRCRKWYLRLLVAMADHSVEEAVWSTHWVLVAFLLMFFDLLVDVVGGLLICGKLWVVEVG